MWPPFFDNPAPFNTTNLQLQRHNKNPGKLKNKQTKIGWRRTIGFVYALLSSGQIIFFHFLWSKGQNCFPTLGGQIIYFIYNNCQTPSRNQLIVPKTNQEINEPSIKLFAYILLWDKECVLSFTFLSLRPNKF
jgi:hypothetical protein